MSGIKFNVLHLIRVNIFAYNRHMTDEYYDRISIVSRLRLTHPLDRKEFAKHCKNFGLIKEKEFVEFDV